MNKRLISIPRTASNAPSKNTIEWEIPNKVQVTFMLIEKIGYTVIIRVKAEKKHWWNRSEKTFSHSAHDPATPLMKGLEFLEKYGYFIDHKTIEFGERMLRFK
ncbi:MAG: hypothetical protein ABIJ59_07700 [Pseudomonadota bacterium]